MHNVCEHSPLHPKAPAKITIIVLRLERKIIIEQQHMSRVARCRFLLAFFPSLQPSLFCHLVKHNFIVLVHSLFSKKKSHKMEKWFVGGREKLVAPVGKSLRRSKTTPGRGVGRRRLGWGRDGGRRRCYDEGGGGSANHWAGKTKGHGGSANDCRFTSLCVGDGRVIPVGGVVRTVFGTVEPPSSWRLC